MPRPLSPGDRASADYEDMRATHPRAPLASSARLPGRSSRRRRARPPPARRRTPSRRCSWPPTATQLPRGFAIDPNQAIALAKTAPKMIAIHRTHHPLQIVRLRVGGEPLRDLLLLPRARSSPTRSSAPRGQIGATYTGPLILGIYGRGHYGEIFDSPIVLGAFTLMFLLPLLLLRGRSWFDRFDIAALLDVRRLVPAVRQRPP